MSLDRRLSDVLTVEELRSYGRKICIISGVGSGKNYWVENILPQYGSVLLVTSRKIVKDQTLTRDFFTEKAEWDGVNYKVCTHSKIGKFIQSNTRPNQSLDETIFDYVVIDEAHAIVSDATFSDDTNYLWQFITNVKATVILMTATVSIIKDMIEREGFAIIDKTEECTNIRPTYINLTTDNKARELLLTAKPNSKIIYMMPSAGEAYRIENELIEWHLRDDVVAITSSERNEAYSKEERVVREEATYKTIVEENRLPDDVNILLTTTKFREGVNLIDERIKQCITGCHPHVDIRQFAGRVRTGIDTLHIIENKKQNINSVDKFDIDIAKRLIPKFDEVIYQYLNTGFGENDFTYANIENCVKFYNKIENKFDLMKFNRYKNRFELFEQRLIAIEREKQDLEDFRTNTYLYLGNLFGTGVIILLNNKASYLQGVKNRCILFLQDYIGKELQPEVVEKLLNDLKELGLRGSKGQVYEKLGFAISYLGYELIDVGNKNHLVKKIVKKLD